MLGFYRGTERLEVKGLEREREREREIACYSFLKKRIQVLEFRERGGRDIERDWGLLVKREGARD